MLRDKRNDLHKHRNTKRLINSKQQHNANQTNTIAQQKHKTNNAVINCLNCGTMVKSKTGLYHNLLQLKTNQICCYFYLFYIFVKLCLSTYIAYPSFFSN
jgi:hypothetical protein